MRGLTSGAALARNALHLLVGQVGTTILSIVLSAALGRALGAEDFGLYFFLMSSTLFAYTVVEWGQQPLLVQAVARSPERSGALLGGALALRTAGSLLGAALTGGFLWAAGYGARTGALAALFVLAWLPTSMTLAYGLVFRGHERMDVDARTTVIAKALTLAAVAPALALGGRLPAVIAALGLSGLASLVIVGLRARRIELPALRLDAGEMRWLLRDGLPLMLMNVVFLAQNYVETLYLSRLAAPSVLGWYGAARNVAGTLVMAGNILVTASFPRLSRTAPDPEAFRREGAAALRPALALAVLAMLGTYLFADFAIGTIYGAGFAPAVLLLQLMGPTLFLIFVDMVLGSVALAAGKARAITRFKFGALLVATAVGYPLIRFFEERMGNGAIGAIAAFGLSELFMVVVFLSLVPRSLLDRQLRLDLLRALASGAVSLLAVRLLPWNSPAVAIPVCLLAFAAAARVSGLVRPADMQMLASLTRR